jgi:bifunctional non-homologous end joining protein LigD
MSASARRGGVAADGRRGAAREPLRDYRRKRRFEATPEPGPAVGSSPRGDLYVIQKHAARQLHYDLRLELDGVLLSWAVPKGPSLDPAARHLAVRVEDHPIDYSDFEGTIPKGQYGGGTVMVWDRGRWAYAGDGDPAADVRAGHLKFRLEGAKLRGAWMLVRLKPRPDEPDRRENWLLFKERDDEARSGPAAEVTKLKPDSAKTGRSLQRIAADLDRVWSTAGEDRGEQPRDPAAVPGARRAPLPERCEPELATLVDEAPRGDDWLHEIKLDGYRVLCRLEGSVPRLLTRRGADWTSHVPTLVAPLGALPARAALLDGEVVYVGDDGRTSFLELASALQNGTDRDGRIVYYVFDLLHLDGYDLTRASLRDRKRLLEGLLAGQAADARVRYVEHLEGRGEEFFRQTCAFDLEGAIAKRADSPYRPGRGRDWLKVKCLRRQELVIGGFTERAGTAGGVGALLLGFHEGPGEPLRYAGRVGTGWDDATMRELRARLDRLVCDGAPFAGAPRGGAARGVRWVAPELVAEIEYLSWDREGRLRHASFEGLRDDKPAAEVVVERAPPPDAAADPRHPPDRRPASRGAGPVAVGGVPISHPDRVVYPDVGLTKVEVARYYEDVAEWFLPHVVRRPLTVVRCPAGLAGQCFFQKHAADGFPESVIRVPMAADGGNGLFVAVDSLAGVLALVQAGALEFHVWGSRLATVERPDQMVFDLDPAEDLPFSRVNEAARILHDLLGGLGLASFVKTSGGKGLHVVVPLEPTRGWDDVRDFSRALSEAMVAADPAHFVATMSLTKRPGKTFIDYLRNGRGATFVAPYGTRRRPGAPVSAPVRWDELTSDLRGDRFTVATVRRRLASLRADPWQGYADVHQEITPAMLRAVGLGDGGKRRGRMA